MFARPTSLAKSVSSNNQNIPKRNAVRSYADAKAAKKSILDVIKDRLAQEKAARAQKESKLSAEDRRKASDQRIEKYLEEYFKHEDAIRFAMPNFRNQARNYFEYERSLSVPVDQWKANRRKYDKLYQQYVNGEVDITMWNDFISKKPIGGYMDRISEDQKKAVQKRVEYITRLLNAQGESISQSVPTSTDIKKKMLSDLSQMAGVNYSSFESMFTWKGFFERYHDLHNKILGKISAEDFEKLLNEKRPGWKKEFEDAAARFQPQYEDLQKKLAMFEKQQQARDASEKKWDGLFMPKA